MFGMYHKTLYICTRNAEIAQLVEHNLAKVRVASSSLVFRSFFERMLEWRFEYIKRQAVILTACLFCFPLFVFTKLSDAV